MSMSGIGIDTEIVTKYADFKRKGSSIAFLIFYIKNENLVTIEKTVTNEEVPALLEEAVSQGFKRQPHETDKFALLRSMLLKSPPRYAVVVVDYQTDSPTNKVVLVTWCSDNAKVKERMLISSTKDNLSKKLEGVTAYQANDEGDLEFKTVCDSVSKGKALWS